MISLGSQGFEQLLSIARLSPQESARALQAVWRWCDKHGVAVVDDLMGGGISLEADAAIWEDFLSALSLSELLANRIRRELMARRAALVDAAVRGRAPPTSSSGGSSAAMPVASRSHRTGRRMPGCSVQ